MNVDYGALGNYNFDIMGHYAAELRQLSQLKATHIIYKLTQPTQEIDKLLIKLTRSQTNLHKRATV